MIPEIRFTIEGDTGPTDFDYTREVDKQMIWAMREAQLLVANKARDNIAVATGTARRSITVEPVQVEGNRIIGAVGAGGMGAPYAKVIEYGSGIYSEAEDSTHQLIIIRPVHAKALRFVSSGNMADLGGRGGEYFRLSGTPRTWVQSYLKKGILKPTDIYLFRQKVVQLGHKPRPFLRPAFEESREEVLQLVDEAVIRLLSRIHGVIVA